MSDGSDRPSTVREEGGEMKEKERERKREMVRERKKETKSDLGRRACMCRLQAILEL